MACSKIQLGCTNFRVPGGPGLLLIYATCQQQLLCWGVSGRWAKQVAEVVSQHAESCRYGGLARGSLEATHQEKLSGMGARQHYFVKVTRQF
jgi:hypothetical protein